MIYITKPGKVFVEKKERRMPFFIKKNFSK